MRERANLTNGNVAAIRSEIQDLKEDQQERDDIAQEERERVNGEYYSEGQRETRKSTRRSRVARNRSDVNKRKSIDTDRRSQEHSIERR